jgi:hypothetical protein
MKLKNEFRDEIPIEGTDPAQAARYRHGLEFVFCQEIRFKQSNVSMGMQTYEYL